MQDAMTSQTNNWRYVAEDAHICDYGYKIEHFAVNVRSLRKINLDFTPRTRPSVDAFRALVEMGFPPRPDMSPWSEKTVLQAFATWKRRQKLMVVAQCVNAMLIVAFAMTIMTALVPHMRELTGSASARLGLALQTHNLPE